MKKMLCVFLAVVFVFSLCVPSFAMTRTEWDAYLAGCADAGRGIIMQPGADGTRKNFSWYVPADTAEEHAAVAAA